MADRPPPQSAVILGLAREAGIGDQQRARDAERGAGLRQLGDPGDRRVRRGRQPLQRAVDELAVLPWEPALDAPHLREPEDVDLGPAQPLHRAQRLERRDEPAAELELALHPERAQQRWVEQELVPGARPELGVAPDALDRVEVQAGDLVLVLVGHQLVEVARVGLGDRGLARRAAACMGCALIG